MAQAQRNYYHLFAGLLILLLVEPFLEGLPGSDALILLAFTSMMIVGAFGLTPDSRAFRVGGGLAAVGLLAAVGYYATSVPALQLIELVTVVAFCLLSIAVKVRGVVLEGGAITSNRIVGALCIYLLLGVLWAALYSLVEFFDPSAFALADGGPKEAMEHFLYFSFVTLTTVGYGDITPLHPLARTLSYLEAVVGQLFLAVLIAGLVGRRVPRGGFEQS